MNSYAYGYPRAVRIIVTGHVQQFPRGLNSHFGMILSGKARHKQGDHLVAHQTVDHGIMLDQNAAAGLIKTWLLIGFKELPK
jgi:hypothetical protein